MFRRFSGLGVGKKGLKLEAAFWRCVLGTFWRILAVFLLRAKSENTSIYSVGVALA